MEETKPLGQDKVHCLICTQRHNPLENDSKPSDDENTKIFNVLCNSLKIKVAKKNSWDFKKEPLPFCASCTHISKELSEIEKQIRALEKRLEDKVSEIKRLIISSDDSFGNIKDWDDDERFLHFRQQVTGTRTDRGRNPKPKTIAPPSPKKIHTALSVPPKLRFRLSNLNKSSEESTETLETISSSPAIRRSTRVSKKVHKPDIGPDLEEDRKDEDFDNDDKDYSVDDDLDIKPEVDGQSDVQVSGHQTRLKKKQATPTTSETKKNYSRKNNRKSILPKKPRTSSQDDCNESEDEKGGCENKPRESTWDSDYEAESSGFDNDPGSGNKRSASRKWTKDKETGQLTFEGIEIFTLGEGGLKCSTCGEIIEGDTQRNNRLKMKRHIQVKHLELFSCFLCQKVMTTKKYLDTHVKLVHEKSVIVNCDICGKPFTSTNAMRRHAWNHQNEEEKQEALAAGKKQYGGGGRRPPELQCGTCGRLCKGLYILKKHEATHIDHSQRMKHMCQICGALYSMPETLKSHIKMAHENNHQLTWIPCPYPNCGKRYPQKGRLEKHMRCHTGEKPYKCSECSMSFSQSTLLSVHKLKHKNLRPHQCEHCEMSFRRRYHLQRHTQIYHQSENPPTKKAPYRSENGTRKAAQKRTRKKIPFDLDESAKNDDNNIIVSDPRQEHVDADQILSIPITTDLTGHDPTPPTPATIFNFTSSSSCTYPFTYTFQGTGSDGNGHEMN